MQATERTLTRKESVDGLDPRAREHEAHVGDEAQQRVRLLGLRHGAHVVRKPPAPQHSQQPGGRR